VIEGIPFKTARVSPRRSEDKRNVVYLRCAAVDKLCQAAHTPNAKLISSTYWGGGGGGAGGLVVIVVIRETLTHFFI